VVPDTGGKPDARPARQPDSLRGFSEGRGARFIRTMKPAPYLGPEPTIERLRRQFGWMWAACGVTCGHTAALPLDRISRRLGADAPACALRKRLRCTVCGKLGATLSAPSDVDHALAPLPLARVPEYLRREMARDALRSIGVKPAPI
jgi:hypothetical protein